MITDLRNRVDLLSDALAKTDGRDMTPKNDGLVPGKIKCL